MCLGIPGQIVEISDAAQLRAKVDVEGVRREISIALIGLDGPDAARVATGCSCTSASPCPRSKKPRRRRRSTP